MMKKFYVALMCIAALAMTACGGGKSGGAASGGESASTGGLEDGKWPAAIYEKYGIPEIETKGKIVYTELTGEDQSYPSIPRSVSTRAAQTSMPSSICLSRVRTRG